jgi:hypothetical protein
MSNIDKINDEVRKNNIEQREVRTLKDLMDGKVAKFIKDLDKVEPINKQLDNKKIL